MHKSFGIGTRNITAIFATLSMVTTLSACGAGSGATSGFSNSPTNTSFTILTGPRDTPNETFLVDRRDGDTGQSSVGRAAYAVGIDQTQRQMVAQSGYQSGNIGTPRSSGSGSYTTFYRYGVVDEVVRSSTLIRGYAAERSGVMIVNADFDTGRLSADTSRFDVNAQIRGDTFSGTADVTHTLASSGTGTETITTTLEGRIGTNGLVGAFHGSDSNTVIAGGLVGIAN